MHLAGEIMLPDDVAQRLLVLLGSRVENICTLELPGLREGSPLLGAGGPRISLFLVPFFPYTKPSRRTRAEVIGKVMRMA